jgi:hypothetical protein
MDAAVGVCVSVLWAQWMYLKRYYAAGSCRWGRIEQCMWMQGHLCEVALMAHRYELENV